MDLSPLSLGKLYVEYGVLITTIIGLAFVIFYLERSRSSMATAAMIAIEEKNSEIMEITKSSIEALNNVAESIDNIRDLIIAQGSQKGV